MTATREAVLLPTLFLTVALAGGVRPGDVAAVQPPSLFALVLATLLMTALVQSGAFDPGRVINGTRSGLANANGIAILASSFVASAQVFSVMTPRAGVPRLVLATYFLLLMLNTLAAGPDRHRVLRSLGVTFGAAFVLKFVVLDALADPASSRLGRVVQVLFEGVTLGAITQDKHHASAGYLAFATLAVFLVAVWLLPARGAVASPDRQLVRRSVDIER